MTFVEFMTSAETQRNFMAKLKTLPSRKSLLDDPLLKEDPTLLASAQQMKNGRPMPVVAELRAIWDSMRPHYQALLAGDMTAEDAAKQMQARCGGHDRSHEPGYSTRVQRLDSETDCLGGDVGLVVVAACQLGTAGRSIGEKTSLAYLLIGPSLAVIFLTIVYPFFYNVVLSFSNMSLRNFQDWQITGWQNYEQVFAESKFYVVFLKTMYLDGRLCIFSCRAWAAAGGHAEWPGSREIDLSRDSDFAVGDSGLHHRADLAGHV